MRLALPLLVALLPLASALYAGTPVVELTASNFQAKVKSGGVWMVEFYAPWWVLINHPRSLTSVRPGRAMRAPSAGGLLGAMALPPGAPAGPTPHPWPRGADGDTSSMHCS
jgi:hypothetical protein